MSRLDASARHFFHDAMAFALGNPFTPERAKREQRLVLTPLGATEQQRHFALGTALDEHLQLLGLPDAAGLATYVEADRTLLENALVLRSYYRYAADIDEHIRLQLRHPSAQPAPWAHGVIRDLVRQGIAPEQSLLYVEIYFQLRRALHFIRSEITGACTSIVQLRMRLWNTLFTIEPQWYLKYLHGRMQDFSTMLLGETGTGKTAAARAIGCSGYIPYDVKTGRFKESFTEIFLAINLAEYPASLVESQLFGHRKGAFTGAVEHHHGLFARSGAHGAVFIDEIGDVDLPTQTKLLRVLQDREFTPVGSQERLRFQGRVIAATNKDIIALRLTGQFRDDFYYRLCSDVILIPPLRQRLAEESAELGLMLDALIRRAIGEHSEPLARRVEERIQVLLPRNYGWPGNVRELEQCVRRICITGEYAGDSKPLDARQDITLQLDAGTLTADQLLAAYCRQLYQRHGTYEAVARITGLDRRTAKKYLLSPNSAQS